LDARDFRTSPIRRNLLIATSIIAAVVVTACDGPRSPSPTAPGTISANQSGVASSSDGSSSRSGALHLAKECSVYFGVAGQYCTITRSNLKEITAGTREFALKDADPDLAP
jgi:hypothetical protein